jgi:hexosaminidase
MKNEYIVIPQPASIQPKTGTFEITPQTNILADDLNQENAVYLRDFFFPPSGIQLTIQDDPGHLTDSISLKLDPSLSHLGDEGYQLNINRDGIAIVSTTIKGVFYGIQTLRQLLPVEVENRKLIEGIPWQAPCCEIVDKPRFPWRGYMLDEGRHFLGAENIFRTIDLMALQKLNTFHWHLTEDQGWRIEIKSYPKLTEIGSWRAGTSKSWKDTRTGGHDGIPHGGFYTQNEVREIVAYAALRNINIIPEIEIPGHSTAALAAYPELSCTSGPFEVSNRFGIHKDIYCAGKEYTFEFLESVLDEVIDLFPSPVIHIGGDEAPKSRWKSCPDCQKRMQDEGLKDVHELQVYFTNRITEHLESHRRRAIGWNEIIHDDIAQNTIIQYWFGNKKGLLDVIRKGNNVVNSAYFIHYLDHSYSLTPLHIAYEYDPVFKGLDTKSASHILGLEAPMWTEWVPNQDRLDYQTYPRLTAFAETGWTPRDCKEYDGFLERLNSFNCRLDILDVRHASIQDWEPTWYNRLLGLFTIVQPQTRTTNMVNSRTRTNRSRPYR